MRFSENNEHRKYFVERFGVPEDIMKKYSFWERGKRVWAFTGSYIEMDNIETLGIKALSLRSTPKPSTAFLRVIGIHATKNVVELDEEQALNFMRGEDIHASFSADRGYVIVKSAQDILGCGFYNGKDLLINQIPKKYRTMDTWV